MAAGDGAALRGVRGRCGGGQQPRSRRGWQHGCWQPQGFACGLGLCRARGAPETTGNSSWKRWCTHTIRISQVHSFVLDDHISGRYVPPDKRSKHMRNDPSTLPAQQHVGADETTEGGESSPQQEE